MKRKTLIIFAICLALLPTLVNSDTIKAYIVDFVLYSQTAINGRLSYPLISYNDNTYVAIRDVAKLWNRDIKWDGEKKQITLLSPSESENIIKNKETAQKIGEAVIEEYFSDRVTQNDAYFVTYAEANPSVDDFWSVCVVFDFDKNNLSPEDAADIDTYILTHPDARVDINPLTANFRVLFWDTNGNIKEFVSFKS